MTQFVDVVVAVLLLGGVAFSVLAAIGLQQFDDVFARMHCVTKPATIGLLMILAAAALSLGDLRSVAKLALVGVLQLLNTPVGAHMIGRSSVGIRTELNPRTIIDPLVLSGLGPLLPDATSQAADDPSDGSAGAVTPPR